MNPPVYLDNNATTALDPMVLEAMMPYLTHAFGNAHSAHAYGSAAAAAVAIAREQVAAAIGAQPGEVFFVSGATEANNTVILGSLNPGDRLVVAATEHSAVLEPARFARAAGAVVDILPVAGDGRLAQNVMTAALADNAAPTLASIMLANNETGAIHDIAALACVVHEHGGAFHSDAAQALGRIRLDVAALGVDALSLSAHKFHGPKGIGVLYLSHAGRGRLAPAPLLRGGGQEQGLRGGTLNVAAIVGMGRAAELASTRQAADAQHMETLRDALHATLRAAVPDLRVNGPTDARLPNTLNIGVPGLRAAELLIATPEIAASTGSACASDSGAVSHVLQAMAPDIDAHDSIRLSLGRQTTTADIEHAAAALIRAIDGARSTR